MACGNLLRSISGYHVMGMRRKKKSEKIASPMSSDDRVGSNHSGGVAPAAVGSAIASTANDEVNARARMSCSSLTGPTSFRSCIEMEAWPGRLREIAAPCRS
eukprot:1001666-Rhodomonas_salina.2